MPNNIALAKNYTDLLDEVYRGGSVTADLTGDPKMVRTGANANEILYPQIKVTGLGDYSRNSGYTSGAVDLVWKTAQFNYDRGTKISVDTMDDQESFDIAFGMAGSALQREKVAPEADAFTFATLAGTEGISKATPATYADAIEFLNALLVAKTKMDEDEVPEKGRILYATPTLLKLYFPIVLFYGIIKNLLDNLIEKLYFPIVLFYGIILSLCDKQKDLLYFPIVLFYGIILSIEGNKQF